MNWLGITHLTAALLSMASGLPVLLMTKGSKNHRRIGWIYAASMGTVNITAFMIYDLFGRFGPFHIAAIISGLTVVAGITSVIRRRPKRTWIAHHAYWMAWSYVGLMAAAVSEVSTRYLHMHFGLVVGLATGLVAFTGWLLIRTRVPRILKSYGINT